LATFSSGVTPEIHQYIPTSSAKALFVKKKKLTTKTKKIFFIVFFLFLIR